MKRLGVRPWWKGALDKLCGALGVPCSAQMNFLGHLFLSGDDPLVVVGNFMADAVKGGHFDDRPASVVKGIRLHRAIDGFTDNHPAQRSGRQRVRAHAGRYSGVVMDLFFDHLLAERWSEWHSEPLPRFARSMYDLLDRHQVHMDLRTRHMLGHMIKGDWLTGYARIDGIARSLAGLAGRVPEGQVMVGAEVVLVEHLEAYREEFAQFMSDIITHTAPFR